MLGTYSGRANKHLSTHLVAIDGDVTAVGIWSAYAEFMRGTGYEHPSIARVEDFTGNGRSWHMFSLC